MSRLGGAALLGACVAGAALALGSRPLTVAGVGLLLAVGIARTWARAVRGPVSLELAVDPAKAAEGDRVSLRVTARRASRVPVGAVTFRAMLGARGEVECRLAGHGRVASATLDLGRLTRGRYELTDARVELSDHLGLGVVSVPVAARAAVLVRPRLVEVRSLFSEVGRLGRDGRRLLLRRPVGFDFHSVREYEQGESLRRVHWPSTARRGQLMVKELQDAPRDTVAVLLDCDPAGEASGPAGSSFDAAVRSAGSLVLALVGRGRRAVLLTNGRVPQAVPVRTLGGDIEATLDALAVVEPNAVHGLSHALRRGSAAAREAGDLVVVTATLDAAAVEELLRAATLRPVSVVWIDAPSFAGRRTKADPGALRLVAAGLPLAVVRAGDDLAGVLDSSTWRDVAHA